MCGGFYLCIHCDCHCGDSFSWAKPTSFFFVIFFLLLACLLYTVLHYDHELYYIRRIYYICIYTHQSGTVNNELKAYASLESGCLLTDTLCASSCASCFFPWSVGRQNRKASLKLKHNFFPSRCARSNSDSKSSSVLIITRTRSSHTHLQ